MKNLLMVALTVVMACQPEQKIERSAVDAGEPSDAVAGGGQRADAAGDSDVRSPTDTARGKVTVLFFGTSLTAGYGLDPVQAFPNLVARKAAAGGMPIASVNAGLSGETSAGALRRIDWVLKQPVDIVVLETGGNDALRALDADSLRSNLKRIIGRIRIAQPGARILLVVMEAPPNLGARYTASFRNAYRDVAKEERLTLVPFLLDGVAGHDELNQADGIHPNQRGARIVADNIWRALRPVVAEVYGRRQEG